MSEIYAPVGGTVTAVNDALKTSPELVNADPYGDGLDLRDHDDVAAPTSTRCSTPPGTQALTNN